MWINLLDRLPEKWKRILVLTDREKDPVMIGTICGDGNWYFEAHRDGNGAEIPVGKEHILGWQEIPQ